MCLWCLLCVLCVYLSVSRVKVFAWTPVRVFEGHKSDVVDLSWSHSDFLCSASIDHTVMLWHPHRCDLGSERCIPPNPFPLCVPPLYTYFYALGL